MVCPKCKSEDCQVINEVKSKGASLTKLCFCGLCGLAGTGKTKNQAYWICSKCGYKFKA